jgi:hypothetical protein
VGAPGVQTEYLRRPGAYQQQWRAVVRDRRNRMTDRQISQKGKGPGRRGRCLAADSRPSGWSTIWGASRRGQRSTAGGSQRGTARQRVVHAPLSAMLRLG